MSTADAASGSNNSSALEYMGNQNANADKNAQDYSKQSFIKSPEFNFLTPDEKAEYQSDSTSPSRLNELQNAANERAKSSTNPHKAPAIQISI